MRVGTLRSATLLAVALACLWPLGVTSAQRTFTVTQDPVAGARLFRTRGCVQCHAINGVGGTEGPDLGRIARPRSFYDVATAMWNHLPEMAGRIRASVTDRPYLTPNEMSDLTAFLYPARSPDTPEFVDTPGDPQRGRQLLADKGCLVCHSLSGPGRRDVRSLDGLKGVDSPWTVMATMWNHAFLMDLKAKEQQGTWPRLTAEEMADLVASLRALAYPRDR